jgi:hypothetical protein
MKRLNLLLMIVMAVLVAGGFSACTNEEPGPGFENQPPQVWLSAAPPEGSTSKYTVKLYWGGWDPDGEVKYYEYLITDNQTGVFDPADLDNGTWYTVLANDSTFTFSADSLVNPNTTSMTTDFIRSHTFFIRAVDEENARSEYAYRSFTARTISPEVSIRVPKRNGFNAADVPPIATFRWEAKDYIDDLANTQEPESVQYAFKSTAAFGSYENTL